MKFQIELWFHFFIIIIFLSLQKYFEDVGEVDIDPELHIDVIERNWSRLLASHQEKDSIIQDEIKRLDRLQRLAEKVTTTANDCIEKLTRTDLSTQIKNTT